MGIHLKIICKDQIKQTKILVGCDCPYHSTGNLVMNEEFVLFYNYVGWLILVRHNKYFKNVTWMWIIYLSKTILNVIKIKDMKTSMFTTEVMETTFMLVSKQVEK